MAKSEPSDRRIGPTPEIEARFARLAGDLLGSPGVARSTMKGFGRGGLLIGDKLFAMPHRDGLLLKLPAATVAALVASGDGLPFDAGRGRTMREWVVVTMHSLQGWPSLARQAMVFVSDQPAPGR